jgi:uncharacterized repeat protein (TIGR04076 family)
VKVISKILIRVVKGKCDGGYHKIGDTFEIDAEDPLTPQGICIDAFNSILPSIMVLSCDGNFSWEETKTKTRIHCPGKGIVLEIEKK